MSGKAALRREENGCGGIGVRKKSWRQWRMSSWQNGMAYRNG